MNNFVHILLPKCANISLGISSSKEKQTDMRAFLSEQCKEIEENKEWEGLETSSGKYEISREYFMERGTH